VEKEGDPSGVGGYRAEKKRGANVSRRRPHQPPFFWEFGKGKENVSGLSGYQTGGGGMD